MGWDVLVFRLIDPATPASERDESKVLPLVESADIREAIDAVVPGINWSEPTYGWVEIGASHLGFNLARSPARISIWVHGGGDPVTPIVALCKANNWAAFDTTTADFIDLNRPSPPSWDDFNAFRDAALRRLAQANREPTEDAV